MDALTVAVTIIQGLLALGGAAFAWWVQRQVSRIDALDARIGQAEAADRVFDVRLGGAASTDQIRAVMREELDRALQPIHRDIADVQGRVRALETKGNG